jgi:hypothetical protein
LLLFIFIIFFGIIIRDTVYYNVPIVINLHMINYSVVEIVDDMTIMTLSDEIMFDDFVNVKYNVRVNFFIVIDDVNLLVNVDHYDDLVDHYDDLIVFNILVYYY